MGRGPCVCSRVEPAPSLLPSDRLEPVDPGSAQPEPQQGDSTGRFPVWQRGTRRAVPPHSREEMPDQLLFPASFRLTATTPCPSARLWQRLPPAMALSPHTLNRSKKRPASLYI